MRILRDYRHAYLCLAALVVLQAVLYRALPDPVPIHWNALGAIDGYLSKPWGVWLGTLIFIPAIVFMTLAPSLSPHNFPMQPFARIYRHLVTVFAGFCLWLTLLTDAIALGWPISLPRQILFAVGVLYLIIGNWMGKLTPNFFMGIRTPWTIASPDVWHRTHRLAGPLIMLAGLAAMGATVLSPLLGITVLIVASVIAFAGAAVYSWHISRSLPSLPQDELE